MMEEERAEEPTKYLCVGIGMGIERWFEAETEILVTGIDLQIPIIYFFVEHRVYGETSPFAQA